jgi:hypothetical protein
MIINTALTLALAAALLAPIAMTGAAYAQAARPTVTVKHRPIVSPGDVSGSWDARQNVIDSKAYERLLATNPAFRQQRKQIECRPITDPQLHQSCLASFNRG